MFVCVWCGVVFCVVCVSVCACVCVWCVRVVCMCVVFCGVFVCACVCVRGCVCVWCVRVWCFVVCLCVRAWLRCGVVCVFLKMKEHLAGKRHAAHDLQHAVVDCLNRLAADWYDVDINKLVSRYENASVSKVIMWRGWGRCVLQPAY
jgi:hypothetical protein